MRAYQVVARSERTLLFKRVWTWVIVGVNWETLAFSVEFSSPSLRDKAAAEIASQLNIPFLGSEDSNPW